MVDQYKRNIDYIRISVTDRCNLRCTYCMPEHGVPALSHHEVLSYEEMLAAVRCFAALGIRKIKITGGEPLVRKNLADLIGGIKRTDGIEEVTLTTNGMLLRDHIEELAEAGVTAVNVSLDSLDPDLYRAKTRGGDVTAVRDGIAALSAYPAISRKINAVLPDGRAGSILSLIDFAKATGSVLRFIEMMPMGLGRGLEPVSEDNVKAVIRAAGMQLEPETGRLGNGPASYYRIAGSSQVIGFISAVSHQFCSRCNRVRMTAEGRLKTCLQYQAGLDIRALLRSGATEPAITEAVSRAIYQKQQSHHFLNRQSSEDEQLGMSEIGG